MVLLAPFAVNALAAGTGPNVLVIVSDDQRWDELGQVQRELGSAARFPFLRTPRLDTLASEGLRLRNAFVTTSLCSPSRSAILTGQYNHRNGIIDNATPMPDLHTWASALRAAGYRSAYIGKWHHGMQADRPGFDHSATYLGQGDYNDTQFWRNGRRVASSGYVDSRTVDFAIEFLEEKGDQPFAMMVGFKAMHEPFIPMQAFAGNYTGQAAAPPPNWDVPAPWSSLKLPTYMGPPGAGSLWRNRLQTLDGLDHNVGLLLDALERLGLTDNTLVIFTSDNGYYLGEHHLGDKRSAYEESMRVPMLLRLPGTIAPGTAADALALNIDIAPTILDLAGLPVPDDMQGASLRPLFSGESHNWRTGFLYEHWRLPVPPGEDSDRQRRDILETPTIVALRTQTHKLVTYPGNTHWNELFDLRSDPHEMRNLNHYSGAQQLREQLCDQLTQLMQATDYRANPAPESSLLQAAYQSARRRLQVLSSQPAAAAPNC